MKEYYECHITMDASRPAWPEGLGRMGLTRMVEDMGWSFSAINGDPDLGPGLKCYATRQFNTKHPKEDVIKWLDEAAKVLYNNKITVLRRKVELVIHDDRSPITGE